MQALGAAKKGQSSHRCIKSVIYRGADLKSHFCVPDHFPVRGHSLPQSRLIRRGMPWLICL